YESLAPGESDSSTVTYVVEDADGAQNTSTVTVTINGVNDLEDGDETATTDEDTPTDIDNLLLNSVDPEAGAPVVTSAGGDPVTPGTPLQVAGSTGGVFTIASDGTASFDPNAEFEDLEPGESRVTTIEYTVEDDDGGLVTSTVTVTVTGESDNTDPTAVNDDYATTETQDGVFPLIEENILGNDTDPENDDLDVTELSFNGTDAVRFGDTFLLNVTTALGNSGALSVNALTGELIFSAGDGFSELDDGDSDSFTVDYGITDGNGGSDDAQITITVNGTSTNSRPDAVDNTYGTTEITDGVFPPINDNILTNDTDPENDDLDIIRVTFDGQDAAQNGAGDYQFIATTARGNRGVVAIDPETGEFTFVALDGFAELGDGEVDQFTFEYEITDGNGGRDAADVTVVVDGTSFNSRPDAVDNTFGTTEVADGVVPAINGNVLDNDTDPEDDPLEITSVTFQGTELTKIDPVNFVLFAFTDKGNGGAVQINSQTGDFIFVPGDGFAELGDGEVDGFTLTYEISDGNGGTDTADIVITVDGTTQNLSPNAVNDRYTTTEISDGVYPQITGNLLEDDTDPDAGEGDSLSITGITLNGLDGQLFGDTFFLNATTDGGISGALAVNSLTGELQYVPGDGAAELGLGDRDQFTFQYEITDGNGGTDTADVTIEIVGSASNLAPDAVDDRFSTDEVSDGVFEQINGNILGNDTDPDRDDLSVASISYENQDAVLQNGTWLLAFTNDLGNSGSVGVDADSGDFTFVAGDGFAELSGQESDTFTLDYTITDGNGGTDDAQIEITVNGGLFVG
ncbi:MAG: Ig-like domain-containing protein, partial [Pseudomonadota bacterium]